MIHASPEQTRSTACYLSFWGDTWPEKNTTMKGWSEQVPSGAFEPGQPSGGFERKGVFSGA